MTAMAGAGMDRCRKFDFMDEETYLGYSLNSLQGGCTGDWGLESKLLKGGYIRESVWFRVLGS